MARHESPAAGHSIRRDVPLCRHAVRRVPRPTPPPYPATARLCRWPAVTPRSERPSPITRRTWRSKGRGRWVAATGRTTQRVTGINASSSGCLPGKPCPRHSQHRRCSVRHLAAGRRHGRLQRRICVECSRADSYTGRTKTQQATTNRDGSDTTDGHTSESTTSANTEQTSPTVSLSRLRYVTGDGVAGEDERRRPPGPVPAHRPMDSMRPSRQKRHSAAVSSMQALAG